jgi:hypothetical protein
MKRFLFVGFLALGLSQANAAENAPMTGAAVSDSLVANSLNKLRGQVTIDLLSKVRGEMARISDMCPSSWIPLYYQAWLGIQTTLYTRNDKNELMEECLNQIETAEKLSSADVSELHALKAYYYYVLIAINSKVNGPKYYSNVFKECEKSLEKNPQNPRALAISCVFKKQMGRFLNANADEDQQELQKITELFDKEDKNTILPRWGKEVLSFINRK